MEVQFCWTQGSNQRHQRRDLRGPRGSAARRHCSSGRSSARAGPSAARCAAASQGSRRARRSAPSASTPRPFGQSSQGSGIRAGVSLQGARARPGPRDSSSIRLGRALCGSACTGRRGCHRSSPTFPISAPAAAKFGSCYQVRLPNSCCITWHIMRDFVHGPTPQRA